MKEEKKRYITNGKKANIQAQIERKDWMKAKAIMTIKGQTKDDYLTEAVRSHNEKNKEVLK